MKSVNKKGFSFGMSAAVTAIIIFLLVLVIMIFLIKVAPRMINFVRLFGR